jgi:hypothetical protein
MTFAELLRWQWNGYSRSHAARANLLMHIVAVPLFLAGNVGLVLALANASSPALLASLAAVVVSLVLQGRGHRVERVPPEPFTGPANAVYRLVAEQWITFPRFVLSGGWLRALLRGDGT